MGKHVNEVTEDAADASQNSSDRDRAEILRVIEADLASYMGKDLAAWSDCYLQDARMTSICMTANRGMLRAEGFPAFQAMIARAMQAVPDPAGGRVERQGIQITVSGGMAWAIFDQVIDRSGDPMEPGHLAHCFRLFERHDGQWRIAFHADFEPYRSTPRGPLIEVDETARITWMNEAARETMNDFGGLTVSAGRLRVSQPSLNDMLHDAIRNAASLRDYVAYNTRYSDDGQKATFPVVLGENEAGGLRICLVSVEDYKVYVSFDDAAALQRRLAAAAVVYGLSEAQLRLAMEIAQGHDLPTAAGVMDISVNTARTHLRRMFDKTGVHAQPALLRILLSVG
ncbi:MAG: hypothetical protein ACR2RE_26465 [Geminicoccaceae bacterium]